MSRRQGTSVPSPQEHDEGGHQPIRQCRKPPASPLPWNRRHPERGPETSFPPWARYGMIPRHDNSHRPARPGRALGDRPAVATAPTPPPLGRPDADHPRPQLLRRDHLYGPHLHPWRLLPAKELDCGSPATVWRRLNQWATAGVFEALHLDILDRLGERGRLDWSRASVDSASVRAKRGGSRRRKSRRSRQAREKIHLVCDGGGLPLTAAVTAANIPDVTMLPAVVDDVPAVRTPRAGGVPGRKSSTPTKATTARPTAPTCGVAGSPRGSPGVGSSRLLGWGGIAGG
jgi:hypothetical protein